MQHAGLIDTIRAHIYKIFYKWGYKLGHLMAKLGSLSFIKGIRTAFSNTITEEMNLNLAADNFSNIFDTVATATVRDLTTQISQDLENNWDNDADLAALQSQAMEELHIERTIDSLSLILENPNHPVTLESLAYVDSQEQASLTEVIAALEEHNEQKPPEAKELLLAVQAEPGLAGNITYVILSNVGEELHQVSFTKTQNTDGEWYLDLVV